ncbi:uncharacterized protein [Rutidosis leptorrhynchoides]|uniref:uncharacterized protein n=1 Tax=Rutidosis leptorrhynchoides TaxID=125765 RepID=UPI003A9A48F7
MVTVGSCLAFCLVIQKMNWFNHQARSYSGKRNLRASTKQTTPKVGHNEFLTRPKKTRPLGSRWNTPVKWANSPVKGMSSPFNNTGRDDVYSTYHKIPTRKKFSEEEWEEFTEESTRQSIAELASSPEFTYWLIKNADRIKLSSEDEDSSYDNGSETDSTDEYVQDNQSWPSHFSW